MIWCVVLCERNLFLEVLGIDILEECRCFEYRSRVILRFMKTILQHVDQNVQCDRQTCSMYEGAFRLHTSIVVEPHQRRSTLQQSQAVQHQQPRLTLPNPNESSNASYLYSNSTTFPHPFCLLNPSKSGKHLNSTSPK